MVSTRIERYSPNSTNLCLWCVFQMYFNRPILETMKNESSAIALIEIDHGPCTMNKYKLYQKLSCIKEWSCFQTIERSIQMSTANKAKISKSQRNRVPPRQYEASHIFSSTYKIVKTWLRHNLASSILPRPCNIGLQFILQNFLNDKSFSNNNDRKSQIVELFVVKGQIFYKRGMISYQTDDEKPSNRQEDVWLIQDDFCMKKFEFISHFFFFLGCVIHVWAQATSRIYVLTFL